MTANQKTVNRKYCFSTNQRKNKNLVLKHMTRQVNVSCPVFPASKYREGGYDCRLILSNNAIIHKIPVKSTDII